MNPSTTPDTFERHLGLGGSDVAAALGLSPFKTPLQLWAEKRKLPSASVSDDALHLRLGHHLEPFIAAEFERQSGLQTHTVSEAFVHPDYPMFYGHIDRFVTPRGEALWSSEGALQTDTLLECKSAQLFARHQWGEAGSDQMPAAYLLQVIWYLALTGCKRAVVAVLLGNQRVDCYEVLRDETLEAMVLAKAKRFWDEHVLNGVPPEPIDLNDVKLLYPESSDQVCEASDELLHVIEQLHSMQRSLTEQEGKVQLLRQQIQSAMGEASSLSYRGEVLATWKQARASERVDLHALQAAHPALVASFKQTVPGARRFVLKAKTRHVANETSTQGVALSMPEAIGHQALEQVGA